MVTIDRECLISEKQSNIASPEGARIPKEAMLLRDIFKFTKPSLDAFRPFGLISRACQRPRGPPIALTVYQKFPIHFATAFSSIYIFPTYQKFLIYFAVDFTDWITINAHKTLGQNEQFFSKQRPISKGIVLFMQAIVTFSSLTSFAVPCEVSFLSSLFFMT